MPMYVERKSGIRHLEVPYSDQMTSESVWHYTGAEGLLGILQKDVLWASSPISLNDSEEIHYGIGVFGEAWTSLPKTEITPERQQHIESILMSDFEKLLLDDIYLVCASRSADSLNQWRGYADGQGYAIELSTASKLAVIASGPSPLPAGSPKFLMGWYEVVYDRSAQLKMATEMLAFLLDPNRKAPSDPLGVDRGFVANMVVRFKHVGFSDEKEVRFVARRFSAKEEYRRGPRGVVPFIKLTTALTTTAGTANYTVVPDKLPICSVRCGPLVISERSAAEEPVRRLMKSCGYAENVSSSDIPYRVGIG
jgi:hypothetical protein